MKADPNRKQVLEDDDDIELMSDAEQSALVHRYLHWLREQIIAADAADDEVTMAKLTIKVERFEAEMEAAHCRRKLWEAEGIASALASLSS